MIDKWVLIVQTTHIESSLPPDWYPGNRFRSVI